MHEDKTINIKIPFDVHKRLKILATMEGISLKDFTTKALKEYCEERECVKVSHDEPKAAVR
jgi:predicted HicB family RNase H-like nuclease